MTDANKLAQTLAERGSRYGDFTDHARICQNLKRTMCAEAGWERLNDVQKQSLEVIADKVGRILSGDPNYADNWHDIQGYAKLAEDRLPPEFGQQNTIDCRSDEQKGFNDPRTVEGVDVAFETEKHMNFAPESCECHRCIEEKGLRVGGVPLSSAKMILCPTCGNKRCPKANDHRNECSGSNEPGQPGSAYQ